MRGELQQGRNREAELEKQGWTRRFVAVEPRLSEAVELYRSLGYEVRLEPATFDRAAGKCQECFVREERDRSKTIYTKPRRKG